MFHILLSTFLTTLEISALVLLLMSVVELLNIGSRGRIVNYLKKSSFRQLLFSTLIGAIPGCGGGFAVVSLYSHGVVSFGSICAAMIASCGDEAFYMISVQPIKYLILLSILIPLGFMVGLIINLFNKKVQVCQEGLNLHPSDTIGRPKFSHILKEHIWEHIIKHHLPTIFIWTFAALLICNILLEYSNLESFINSNTNYHFLIILIAIAVGMIPQSGPHLIFIALAMEGVIPFYVVIVNMIAQQGHVSLPIFSESKRTWIESKAVCAAVALIFGVLALWKF